LGTTDPTDETALGSSASETHRASPVSPSGWLSSSSPGDGRFESGTILGDRYRIIGLLGRGGMGEVYRADDLRLGQPVALKFLPQHVTGDAVRLAQFHNEVRTARQVSHRNVCRVYDIGEAGGRIFLSMDFVDGEDLASLLKRIGRFPPDRAIEIARQVCAGLAAAHEQGVLHRDLKPANVMLDREGRVRITDFGLAGLAHEITDIRAGTPAYMAPEQLAGREVSIRSDLFALGLLLFEICTGKHAFDAKNIAELLRMHDEGLALMPTSAVHDLDPAIERVILRCLEREPARRPATAIAVSAALPGGDPLAAALAAGETPSPEMVANAGQRVAIAAGYGLSAIAVIVASLVALMYATYETSTRIACRSISRRSCWPTAHARSSRGSAIARPPSIRTGASSTTVAIRSGWCACGAASIAGASCRRAACPRCPTGIARVRCHSCRTPSSTARA
jgi:serine/threonine-protein kinase